MSRLKGTARNFQLMAPEVAASPNMLSALSTVGSDCDPPLQFAEFPGVVTITFLSRPPATDDQTSPPRVLVESNVKAASINPLPIFTATTRPFWIGSSA